MNGVETIEIKIVDEPSYGNLHIRKYGTKNNGDERKLKDIRVKIYSKTRGKWLKFPNSGIDEGDGKYNYTNVYEDEWKKENNNKYYADSFEDASEFVTNDNGKIDIFHIERGEYEIWEVETFNIEYDIEEQGETSTYDSSKHAVRLATVIIDDKETNVEKPIKQNERDKGKLKIIKLGIYGDNGEKKDLPLKGMKFKIRSTVEGDQKNGEWVKIIDESRADNPDRDNKHYPDGPVYDFGTFAEAEVFETDENGVIEVPYYLYTDFNPYSLVELGGEKEAPIDEEHADIRYYIKPLLNLGENEPEELEVSELEINEKKYLEYKDVIIPR